MEQKNNKSTIDRYEGTDLGEAVEFLNSAMKT